MYRTNNELMFSVVIECGNCGSDVLGGLYATLLESIDGRPVIPYDIASESQFSCTNCNAAIYTGDFEENVYTEGGDTNTDDEEVSDYGERPTLP